MQAQALIQMFPVFKMYEILGTLSLEDANIAQGEKSILGLVQTEQNLDRSTEIHGFFISPDEFIV